jgi:methionyl-tRNA formyltransferase
MPETALRIVYAGTPEFAAQSLEALLQPDPNRPPCEVVAVYSQPDRPAGRGRKLAPSPVKKLAMAHNLPVFQPASFKEDGAIEALQGLKPDLLIVAAYGLLLPKAVLDIPKFGCINIHASLLPRWRGAAPIQRAIQAGDTETGITIMQMDVGLDTGGMIIRRAFPIAPEDTGGSLHDKLATLGAELIIEYLAALTRGTVQATVQDNQLANYAHKLSKDESRIDWTADAGAISRSVRAFNPWPVCYTEDQGERVRILAAIEIAAPGTSKPDTSKPGMSKPGTVISRDKSGIVVQCGHNALSIQQLQLPGGNPLSVTELLNGGKPFLQLHSLLG